MLKNNAKKMRKFFAKSLTIPSFSGIISVIRKHGGKVWLI